jgi:hypothetical protein
MKHSVLFSALALVVALLPAAVSAQERTTNLGKVGAWNILAFESNGQLSRCSAELINGHGSLRIAQVASNGNWSVSVPGDGLRGDPIEFSASFNQLNVPAADFKNHGGQRLSAPLAPAWIREFRKNGTLTLRYGGKTKTWQFVNSGQALQEVTNCVRDNK